MLKLKFGSKDLLRAERQKEKTEYLAVIVILIIVFITLLVADHIASRRAIKVLPYEGEVPTYDGSLHRNLSSPIGSE